MSDPTVSSRQGAVNVCVVFSYVPGIYREPQCPTPTTTRRRGGQRRAGRRASPPRRRIEQPAAHRGADCARRQRVASGGAGGRRDRATLAGAPRRPGATSAPRRAAAGRPPARCHGRPGRHGRACRQRCRGGQDRGGNVSGRRGFRRRRRQGGRGWGGKYHQGAAVPLGARQGRRGGDQARVLQPRQGHRPCRFAAGA